MAYTHYVDTTPLLSQDGDDAVDSMRNNMLALRDAVIAGAMVKWDATVTIGYGYGGAAGLRRDRAAGRHYRDYNREQQAQIAQDYYELLQTHGDTSDYDAFIAELRAGEL